MQDNQKRELEKAALALAFPAGLTAYFIHSLSTGDWLTSAGWVPSVSAAIAISFVLFLVNPNERLSLTNLVALTAMHIMGGATLTLLLTIALPGMPTVPALVPMLLWLKGTALVAFAATDLALLALMMFAGRER
ncbi:MAG: hypothetical protein ABIV13_02050 [Fimbriimonadales bacterium]